MRDTRITINSVVQANELAGDWTGCFVHVEEIKTWGIQGYTQIPKSGAAYIRLKWEQIEYIGQAVLIKSEEP